MNFKSGVPVSYDLSSLFAGAVVGMATYEAMKAFQEMVTAVKDRQEPGPREWSPRTDPRYCRKAVSGA